MTTDVMQPRDMGVHGSDVWWVDSDGLWRVPSAGGRVVARGGYRALQLAIASIGVVYWREPSVPMQTPLYLVPFGGGDETPLPMPAEFSVLRASASDVYIFAADSIYRARDGAELFTMPSPIRDLRFDGDEPYVALSDGIYHLDRASGELANVTPAAATPFTMAVSRGRLLVQLAASDGLRLYDIASGARIALPIDLESQSADVLIADAAGNFIIGSSVAKATTLLRPDGSEIYLPRNFPSPSILAADAHNVYWIEDGSILHAAH